MPDYHGMELGQEIYTPRNISLDTISPGDHPYVSTLSLKQIRIRNFPGSGTRIGSEFQVGILGPAAMGSLTQEIAHTVGNPSRPPMGWEYQLKNDIILNYNLSIRKKLCGQGKLMGGISGKGRLGTLNTDLEGGIWIIFDRRSGYFQRLGPTGDPGLNLVFMAGTSARYVIYDATLQGGVFNRTSPHTIPSANIARWLGSVQLSLTFEYSRHQLDCSANWISGRFRGALPHAWTSFTYHYWF